MRSLITIAIIITGLSIFAQAPIPYSFSEQEEFSQKTTYFLFEDSKRNIWLATDEGLFKWKIQVVSASKEKLDVLSSTLLK